MIYKKEIEDLKVQVSQGEFRNDNLSAKNSDLATRYSQMDIELRRINENNVELSVRNDSMKTEIETLRARLAQTEQRAVSSDRKAETIEAKLAAFEREHGDIAALKAELNLRNVTLREEIERLRRSNMDLSNKLSLTSDARRRIISNLTSLQAGLGTSIRLVEDLSPNPSDPTGTMRMAESPSTRVVANSSAVQPGRRTPIRGVPLSYTDEPVESVAPGQTSPPPIIDDQNFLEDDQN
jgi:chromosome segregation ATPase